MNQKKLSISTFNLENINAGSNTPINIHRYERNIQNNVNRVELFDNEEDKEEQPFVRLPNLKIQGHMNAYIKNRNYMNENEGNIEDYIDI